MRLRGTMQRASAGWLVLVAAASLSARVGPEPLLLAAAGLAVAGLLVFAWSLEPAARRLHMAAAAGLLATWVAQRPLWTPVVGGAVFAGALAIVHQVPGRIEERAAAPLGVSAAAGLAVGAAVGLAAELGIGGAAGPGAQLDLSGAAGLALSVAGLRWVSGGLVVAGQPVWQVAVLVAALAAPLVAGPLAYGVIAIEVALLVAVSRWPRLLGAGAGVPWALGGLAAVIAAFV